MKKSWANARVKLHSQVHFGSKKISKFKKICIQKRFGQKRFWAQNNVESKKNVGPKRFPSPKYKGLKKI